MTSREIKNPGVSIRSKLLNIARDSGVEYNYIVMRYAQERFLYRLSKSGYAGNLILKGALLLFVSGGAKFRQTKDIDFLGRGISNEENEIKRIIGEISGKTFEDGIEFKGEKLKTETISDLNEYSGVRIKLPFELDTIKSTLTIDIGYGDALYKKPQIISYPVILNMAPPKIRAYPFETVIAEKFEAIVKLNYLTSRMKDFYDIIFIAENFEVSSLDLINSIEKTFFARNTLPEKRKVIYESGYKNDSGRQKQWKAFLNRIKSDEPRVPDSFSRVIDIIKLFIEPVFHFGEMNYSWDIDSRRWRKEK